MRLNDYWRRAFFYVCVCVRFLRASLLVLKGELPLFAGLVGLLSLRVSVGGSEPL